MKFSPTLSVTTRRVLQGACAIALAASMTACGGGDDNNNSTPSSQVSTSFQVVSFGDSLSDVGTYAPNVQLLFGGGRFTTNPGQVWTQEVATYYGGSLVAAETGGFGAAVVVNPNGYGYAQGGALVATGAATSIAGPLTVPVTQQVANYVSLHGTFTNNQLVLIQGGANDIIAQAQLLGAGSTTATAAGTAVATAAYELAQTVGQIVQAGATHVVVMNVPDIAKTPATTLATDPTTTGYVFSQLVPLFNSQLATDLAALNLGSKLVQVDAYSFIDNTIANAAANGFSVSNTATACNLTQMATAAATAGLSNPSQYATSLFCSPQLLVSSTADQTYMFADLLHPTTHLHALFASYAESQINAGFGLK